MAPHPCLPHTPFLYLCPSSPPLSLPSGSFCVRARKGFRDQKAQFLCTDEDTQSHDLPKVSRYVTEDTGAPSEESRASLCPYCWISTILLSLGSAFFSLPKYNHVGKAHPGFSDLDTKPNWSLAGPDLTASDPISPSAFSHQPQSPLCFHP